jgi:uncharacterized membrane protein YgdD (TMEM256/DUF423 family)
MYQIIAFVLAFIGTVLFVGGVITLALLWDKMFPMPPDDGPFLD